VSQRADGQAAAEFFLGCAVWAYRDWVGDFYPARSQAKDFLRLYGDRFTAVEGNTTFYSVPGAEMVQRWRAEMPPAFQFCPKLPRDITHAGALEPQIPQVLAFIARMQPLETRLGPIFAQLPPGYGPAKMADLMALLHAWPHDQVALSIEVRHPAWFQPGPAAQLNQALQAHATGRVLLDTRAIYDGPDDPQSASPRKKPQLPLQPDLTAGFTLVRLITHPDPDRNTVYLQEWAERVADWLAQGIRVYFFVHCPEEGRSPATARDFHHRLDAQCQAIGVNLPPLPWDGLALPPDQLSLF
jgi:uncharacterized protein YecE (DUF72 family)